MMTYTMHIYMKNGNYEAEIYNDYDDAYVGAYTSKSLAEVRAYAKTAGYSIKEHWNLVA